MECNQTKLKHGLEVIRGFDDTCNPFVLLNLGEYFYKRAENSENTLTRTILEQRCVELYSRACSITSKHVQTHRSIDDGIRTQLFSNEYDEKQMNNLAAKAKNILISTHFKNKALSNTSITCSPELQPICIPSALIESYHQLNLLPVSEHATNLEQAKFHLNEAINLLRDYSGFPFDQHHISPNIQTPSTRILNDEHVIDSSGNVQSIDFYINHVTPLKHSAGEYLANFMPETPYNEPEYTPQSPDSSSEHKKCQSPANITPCQSPSLKQLLYSTQQMEADSSSEHTNIPNEYNDFQMPGISQKQETFDMPMTSRRVTMITDSTKVLCTVQGCQSRVAQRRNLKRHIQLFHGFFQEDGVHAGEFGIIRWICKVCKKKNVSQFNYKRHFQSAHSEKIYEIEQNCIKEFTKMPEPIYKQ